MRLLVHGLQVAGRIWRQLGSSADYFWSGVWWTQWRLQRQEARLGRVLDFAGEDSLLARAETERLRRLQAGLKYWRPSSPQVLAALEAAERAGVARQDLRLLALNRDVRVIDDAIRVRRPLWLSLLGYGGLVLVLLHWALLSALIAFSFAGLLAKAVGIAVVSLLYWLLWPGFALYTTRARSAAKRVGLAVEKAARISSPGTASISPIRRD